MSASRFATLLLALGSTLLAVHVAAAADGAPKAPKEKVNWAQPPIGCVEEIVPWKSERACPDLTTLPDPRSGWPTSLGQEELMYWQNAKRPMAYCRAAEVLRREEAQPGSFAAGALQLAWMQIDAIENRQEKIDAVYEASRLNKMPAQVLAGALYQESIFAGLHISPDGNNYSCGVGQFNVFTWCRWANTLTAEKQAEIGWPARNMNCSLLDRNMVKAFYDIAASRRGDTPEYRMNATHYRRIHLEDVLSSFPDAPRDQTEQTYRAVRSFIMNCGVPKHSIATKAAELAGLYNQFIPAGMKQINKYPAGEKFKKVCQQAPYEESYPLNVGWLLAVAGYNAGPRVVDAMVHYYSWNPNELRRPETFKGFVPERLIEALHSAGIWNPVDDLFHFKLRNGNDASWSWFKACVVQRHVARIVQHATVANIPNLVNSIEAPYKCVKSVVDENGKVVQTSVPPPRQVSPGVAQFRASPWWYNDPQFQGFLEE